MKGKMLLVVGAGAGYVLGARAGRERYEQIMHWVRSKWEDPAVQEKVTEVQDTVKEKAPEMQHKVSDAASAAAEKAKAKVGRDQQRTEVDADVPGGAFPQPR